MQKYIIEIVIKADGTIAAAAKNPVAATQQPKPVTAKKSGGKGKEKTTLGIKCSPTLRARLVASIDRRKGEKYMSDVIKRVLAYGVRQYPSKRVFAPLPESIANAKSTSISVPHRTLTAIKQRAKTAGEHACDYAAQMIVAYFKNHNH